MVITINVKNTENSHSDVTIIYHLRRSGHGLSSNPMEERSGCQSSPRKQSRKQSKTIFQKKKEPKKKRKNVGGTM
jgi:hypothetical protein